MPQRFQPLLQRSSMAQRMPTNVAMRLRLQEQASASVYAYDKDPAWSPYKDLTPLLTPAQLDARIKVLEGLKAYADTLVDLTSGSYLPISKMLQKVLEPTSRR